MTPKPQVQSQSEESVITHKLPSKKELRKISSKGFSEVPTDYLDPKELLRVLTEVKS